MISCAPITLEIRARFTPVGELRVESLDRDDVVPRGLDVPLEGLREVGEGEDRAEDEEDRDESDHEVEEAHGALTELLEEESI